MMRTTRYDSHIRAVLKYADGAAYGLMLAVVITGLLTVTMFVHSVFMEKSCTGTCYGDITEVYHNRRSSDDITAVYTVDGTEYEITHNGHIFEIQTEIFKEGGSVVIMYDPEMPSRAFIRDFRPRNHIWLTGVFVVCVFLLSQAINDAKNKADLNGEWIK